MANTVIQIKRSTNTSTPTNGSLATAEPAYSFSSDKLFLGNTAGTGVIEIGGKFYVDMTQAAYTQANAAFAAANSAGSSATVSAAFDQANTARTHANSGFAQANTARDHANSSFAQANTATTNAGNAFGQANTATTNAGAAFGQANTARDHANASFGQANTATTNAGNAFGQANTATTNAGNAFGQANTARDHANAAFAAANSKFSSSGGTITGNVSIVGSLTLSGNTVFQNVTTYQVQDPLIYLASNNYTSDIVDIGFVANYFDGSANLHTGLFREHTNKEYYLFQGYTEEPTDNHIDPGANGFTIAVLNADLKANNITLRGVNVAGWISSSFVQANTARDHANAAFGQANTALSTGQAAFGQANTATTNAGNAFGQANTARDHANAAFGQANTALTTGQAAFGQANTATTNAGNAFDKANGAAYLAFGTVTVSGTSLVADSNNDTLTVTSGNGIVLVADAGTDSFNVRLTATGVTPSTYGGADTVGRFTVDDWGRITSAGNVAIAISAAAVTSGILPVNRGGTGDNTFTTNGVLYGNGSSSISVTAAGTEGQVLQASATGVPSFGMLDGGTF